MNADYKGKPKRANPNVQECHKLNSITIDTKLFSLVFKFRTSPDITSYIILVLCLIIIGISLF